MSNTRLTSSGWTVLRLWTAAMLLAVVSGCGGGGGGTDANPAPTPRVLSGQVVKGLTQGASVSIFRLDDNGGRTLLGSTMSDAQGQFRINQELVAGAVYLLEAVGGEYVNEITGLPETLATPLRGVFVASDSESGFALSALSEAVVSDVEQAGGAAKWSASAVNQANSRAVEAFGISKLLSHRFVDLTTLVPGSDTSLTEDDIGFSLQAGVFAGFWHELRLRSPGLALAQALQSFRSAAYSDKPDNTLTAALTAGLVRFVERVPAFKSSRSQIYSDAGLPTNANSTVFDGAQNSGQSSTPIPNRQLRMLGVASVGNVAEPGTDTFFDTRGALIARRLGAGASGQGFQHVGSASVADVFGDADLAIGRWNKGFQYPEGVTYDAVKDRFITDKVPMEALTRDFVYAAGRTANALPSCGTVYMSPRAQTTAFRSNNGSRTYTLDMASRISFHHANGQTKIGYNIVLRDDLGTPLIINTPFGANEAPWNGDAMIRFQEFATPSIHFLPTGEAVTMNGLLVGGGGNKAVIKIDGTFPNAGTTVLAAAFAQDGSTRPCAPASYAAGSVDPVPATGDYLFSLTSFMLQYSGTTFLSNGTPLIPIGLYAGITETSGVEKAGNDMVGVGLLVPPLTNISEPQAYIYLKVQPSPVVSPAATGVLTYRLVSSTSLLIKNGTGLVSVAPPVQAATLTIDLDNYMGASSASFGTCRLIVDGQLLQARDGTFVKSAGLCSDSGGGPGFVVGGITGGNHRYAVLRYENLTLGTGGAGLLFERVP